MLRRSKVAGLETWDAIVAKCRRQMRRAAKRLDVGTSRLDRELVNRCARMADDPVKAASRMRQVWDLLRKQAGGGGLSNVHRGNSKDGDVLKTGKDLASIADPAIRLGFGVARTGVETGFEFGAKVMDAGFDAADNAVVKGQELATKMRGQEEQVEFQASNND